MERKEYEIKDLANHVRGIYSDSFINQQLVQLLECMGEVERTRGNEPVFPDYEAVAEYYSRLLGEYSGHIQKLLKNTLEIKVLALEIFGKRIEPASGQPSEEPKKGEEKRISLHDEFRKGFAENGLEGKELEKRAISCATYYRKKPELAQYLINKGRRMLFATNYDSFIKARDEIIAKVLKHKRK